MAQFDSMGNNAQSTAGMTKGESAPTDESLTQQMHGLLSEAAERVTFHRVEIERWERIGRAAQAGLNHLQSADPVAKQAPDGFLAEGQPMPSPRF